MALPALLCTICGHRIDRRVTLVDEPGGDYYPSHAVCRYERQKNEANP